MRLLLFTGSILLTLLFTKIEADTNLIKQDFQNLLTWQNTAIVTMGLGFGRIAHPWDDNLVGQAEKVPIFEITADPSNLYGSSTFNLPVTFGLYLFGKAFNRPKFQDVSSDLLRALIWTQVLVDPIKRATHRTRPDGSNKRSFPSGHTANAFAIAGVIHNHYGRNMCIPFYAWSMLVGGGRMEEDRHFLSDVIVGAAIGTIVGRAISHASRSDRLTVFPVPISGGLGLALMFKQ